MRPNEQMENAKWYAVFMRPKMEKHVASVLRTKGYEVCLPCYRTRRKWSDRYQWVELPLFPTYLFCQFDLRDKLPILTTPGVIRLVGHCRAAEPVDEIEMMNLMALVRSGLPAEPWPLIRIGDRARIIAGALAGVEGILLDNRKASRVVLSASILNRAVCVTVSASDVELISKDSVQQPAASRQDGSLSGLTDSLRRQRLCVPDPPSVGLVTEPMKG